VNRYLPVMLGAVLLLTGCAAQPLPDDAPVSDAAQTETPADLETMPETQAPPEETAAPPTEEATEQETLWDFSGEQHDGWKRAYREFLRGNDYTTLLDSDYKDYRFLLFCLDDDAIPELVIRGDFTAALYWYNEETGEVVFVDTFPAEGYYQDSNCVLPGGCAIASMQGSVMGEGTYLLIKTYEKQEDGLHPVHTYTVSRHGSSELTGDPYTADDLLALHMDYINGAYELHEPDWVYDYDLYRPLDIESIKACFDTAY